MDVCGALLRKRKQVPAHHALGMSYHTLGSIKTILFLQNHCESRVGITSIENNQGIRVS